MEDKQIENYNVLHYSVINKDVNDDLLIVFDKCVRKIIKNHKGILHYEVDKNQNITHYYLHTEPKNIINIEKDMDMLINFLGNIWKKM